MSRLRWAIVGWGAGGRVFHAPLIRDTAELELVGVVSTNVARAADARAQGLRLFDSVEDVRAAGVDAVTITTPAGTHVDLAVRALQAGLHVLVDKPFATTGDGARRIASAAADANRLVTGYQNRRWDGDFRTLKDVRDSGELGVLHQFESRIERFAPPLPAWTRDRESVDGGGVLVDLGPHLIDQAVHLLGPVSQVFAELAALESGRVSDDDARLVLRHRSGVVSRIAASVNSAVGGPRFRLTGSRGGVLIDGFDGQEAALFAGRSPQTEGDRWGVEPERFAIVELDRVRAERPLQRGRWDLIYQQFAAAITSGADVPVPLPDLLHVADIFDAARTSNAELRWVTL